LRPSRAGIPALLAVAAALLAPASAGAKLLMATYNEGLEPHVVLQGASTPISNPRQLRLEISAPTQTQAAVHGHFTVRCTGAGKSSTHSYVVTGEAPATRTVPIGSRWSSCQVTRASARYDSQFVEGWIKIQAWGTRR
jgi:hypothetical protein